MLVTTVRRLLVEPQDYYNAISDGWHEDLSAEHPALVLEFVPPHPDEDVSDLDVGQFWRIDTDPSDPADVEALRRKLTSIEDDLDVDFS